MSTKYSALLDRLLNGEDLAEQEAHALMHTLAEGDVAPALAGALLAGLRAKGETADEIRGFATAMRELAVRPNIPDGAPTVDTVGTGGDGSGSLNLSTGTGLLAAASGSRVVKHGNRSVSSRSGSADMLECLGMPLPLHEQQAVACLEATNFTFLFAPAYHPAMKAVVPIRGRAVSANGIQRTWTADQSSGAAVPADWRLQQGCREANGRCFVGHANGARIRGARRSGLG